MNKNPVSFKRNILSFSSKGSTWDRNFETCLVLNGHYQAWTYVIFWIGMVKSSMRIPNTMTIWKSWLSTFFEGKGLSSSKGKFIMFSKKWWMVACALPGMNYNYIYMYYVCLFFFVILLRIVPWDSSPSLTTIWESIYFGSLFPIHSESPSLTTIWESI